MNTLKQAWDLIRQLPTLLAEGLELRALRLHRPVVVLSSGRSTLEVPLPEWEADDYLREYTQAEVVYPSPQCSLDGEAWPCRRVREGA